MPRVRGAQTVERKIYFFRANLGQDGAGRPLRLDVAPVLAHIADLPFTEEGRYLVEPDGDALCCWIDGEPAARRLRFGVIRRHNLPQVENGGNVTPLPIAEAAGLAEVVHVRFYENNVIGMDFNFYGPRITRLPYYFINKARRHCRRFSLGALIRQDAVQQLENLRSIRLFHLKVKSSYIHQLSQANEALGRALMVANEIGEAEDLEIVLRSSREKRSTLSMRLLDFAHRMIQRADLRSNAAAFEVRGRRLDNQKIDTVDLLKDQLIVSKRIAKKDPRSRAVDSEAAYIAIDEAYNELRDQLVHAPELVA